MRQLCWLLESDLFDEGIANIVDEIRHQGMRAEIAHYVPLQSGQTYRDIFDPDDPVIFYGSLGFATQIQRESPWVPGVYYTKQNYTCRAYYPYLGPLLLAQEYTMLPYGELKRRRDYLYNTHSIADTVFIRPDSGGKVFTGQTVNLETFDRDVERMGFYDVPPDELVVVSPPRNIVAEWRFVVIDGRVVAGSQYRRGGQKDVQPLFPVGAFELAQYAVDSGWAPDPLWTVDICETTTGSYYVLEIGTLCCAGWYACDPRPVVEAASRVAMRDWTAARGLDA